MRFAGGKNEAYQTAAIIQPPMDGANGLGTFTPLNVSPPSADTVALNEPPFRLLPKWWTSQVSLPGDRGPRFNQNVNSR